MNSISRARGGGRPLAVQAQVRFLPHFSQLAYLSGAYFLFAVTFAMWALQLP